MYTRVNWEVVNSIKATCTSAIDPNLRLYCFILMYTYVQRWTIITIAKRKKGVRIFALTRSLYFAVSSQDPLVEMRCWPFIHCWREVSA
jgi:hypothetical protein